MGGQGVELRQYYRAVVKRLWLVLLLAAVIAVGVFWRTTSQPPRYASTAKVMLTASNLLTAPTTSTNLGSGGSSSLSGSKADFTTVNNAIAVITSRTVAQRVAKSLGIKDLRTVGSIKADRIGGTNLLSITATTAEREMAAKMVNTTAREFVSFFQEANRRSYRDIRLFIESQMKQADGALEASDQRIQQAKERYAFVDLESATGQASDELSATREDLEETRLRLREDQAKLAAAEARLAREKITRVYSTEIEDNPVFGQLRDRLTALEVERAELSQRYTDRHPKMVQIQGAVAAIKQELAKTARTVVGRETSTINPVHEQLVGEIVSLQSDLAAAGARQAALSASLGSRLAAVRAMPAVERRLNALVRENDILKDNYSSLVEAHQEALIREAEAGHVPAGVQVLEAGFVPSVPVKANIPLFTGGGALIGLLLGAIAAIVLESSDDKIRSAQDAERTLGAPVLAQVPDMAPQRTAPGGTVFLIALVLTLMLGGTLVAARATAETTAGPGAASVLVQLGRSLDGLTARVSQVIR
ncbi:MAG: GumC family protein [bacterium]